MTKLGCVAALRATTALGALLCGATANAQIDASRSASPAGAAQSATGENDAGQADAQAQAADIIVTAQFRSQRLQDTPIAITAVSGAMLEARNQTSIIDIGAFSPNVNLTAATAISGNAVAAFIRGIGQEDSSFALEPGVGIYIDDVYFGTTFGAVLDLTDLDRVEVLRGPQGTLAGKNSLGGAIKLFSKKPDEAGGGFIEATYGRFNRADIRASADVKLADGLYARVSGVERHGGGFFKELDYGCVNPGQGIAATGRAGSDCVLGKDGGQKLYAVRGALRYAPAGSPLEVNLIADASYNHAQPVPSKITFGNFPLARSYVAGNPFAGVPFDGRFFTPAKSYTNYANYGDSGNYTTIFGSPYQVTPGTFPDARKNTANNYGFSGTVDYKLSDTLSVKSITAYRKAYGTAVIDIDGSPINILKESLGAIHKQFTQELRLSGKVGDLVDFTIGGFYYKARDREIFRIQIPTFLYDFATDDPVRNRSEAAFAQVELHPLEGLNFIGGIRYTNDHKVYTFGRSNADGTAISGIPLTNNFLVFGLDGLSGTYSRDRVDYRAGVNYRFSPELMTYAQVSTGFKGGGINPRPFVADQVLPFGPETLRTYEAGFKADLFDRVVRANGALFYNEYKNIQRTLYVCTFSVSQACSLPANAGNAHSKGAELEMTVRPVAGFTLDGSVSYLDFNYTKINAATGITLDMVAPFTNKWQASAGAEYAADLGGAGTLTPRIDWTYQSSFFYNSINGPFNRIPGRSLFNGRLTYTSPDRGWQLSASVTNIADKFYYVAASENITNFGLSNNVVGRPREWSVSVKRKF